MSDNDYHKYECSGGEEDTGMPDSDGVIDADQFKEAAKKRTGQIYW